MFCDNCHLIKFCLQVYVEYTPSVITLDCFRAMEEVNGAYTRKGVVKRLSWGTENVTTKKNVTTGLTLFVFLNCRIFQGH